MFTQDFSTSEFECVKCRQGQAHSATGDEPSHAGAIGLALGASDHGARLSCLQGHLVGVL
jgi:hypothetical protein